MGFSPQKFQLPQVMADKTSRVGLITIPSTELRQIYIPTASLLLNPSTITTQSWRTLLMLKATLIHLIAWKCGNIQSTPSLDPSCNFQQLFILKNEHAMLWKKSISQSPRTSPPINIISSFYVFTFLQSNLWTPYPSSHYAKSQMLYESSEVRPTANIELFRTALLNYPSELSCWYIVVGR